MRPNAIFLTIQVVLERKQSRIEKSECINDPEGAVVLEMDGRGTNNKVRFNDNFEVK